MLIVELTKVAFYTRLVTDDDRNMWLFGTLREDCYPDGNRTSVDWKKVYWYNAERAVGYFPIGNARISYLFDLSGRITLTQKSEALVWVKEDLLKLSQSIASELSVPRPSIKGVRGKMLEFKSQLEECYYRGNSIRMLPQDFSTNDIDRAPSQRAKFSQL